MSRRFGRNQKRRMREQLAELGQERERASRFAAAARRESDELGRVLAQARSILGRHVALPPELNGNHPYPLGGDFDVHIPGPADFAFVPGAVGPVAELHIEHMRQLMAWVEDHGIDNRVIHFRVSLDSGSAAYVISRRAIERMSASELQQTLTPQIAMELAGHLAREIKGGWR